MSKSQTRANKTDVSEGFRDTPADSHNVSKIPQKLFILGHPVAHSKSPAMYNAIYDELGFPWHYDFMDLPSSAAATNFLKSGDFLSVNVTTPYKREAALTATHLAASAKLARGANVLVKKGEALIGFNTDGRGCVCALERLGFIFAGKRVCICGTGPTALSILHAVACAGADDVVLLSRKPKRAQAVLDEYLTQFEKLAHATIDVSASRKGHRSFREAYREVRFRFGSYASSTEALGAADLVINATPLGMNEGDAAPFDTGLLTSRQWVFDVVYGHGETALMAAAGAAGATAHNGEGMLVAQAVATLETIAEVTGIGLPLSSDVIFEKMAHAAGFQK